MATECTDDQDDGKQHPCSVDASSPEEHWTCDAEIGPFEEVVLPCQENALLHIGTSVTTLSISASIKQASKQASLMHCIVL
jgi:hypothetical protein